MAVNDIELGQPAKPIKPVQSKKKLSGKRKAQIIALFIIGLAMWLGWQKLNAPVTGQIVATKTTSQHKISKPEEKPATSSIKNSYFDLSLPGGYRVQSASQSPPGLSYQQTIIKPSALGSAVINIAIKPMPEGGMSGDSSYQLRAQSPSRFSLIQQVVNGESLVLASDSQSASVVAFWPHAGKLATISVSSALANPSTDNNLQQKKILLTVLTAWNWQ